MQDEKPNGVTGKALKNRKEEYFSSRKRSDVISDINCCKPVLDTPMIQSKFIHQIVSLLIETDQYEELLRSQITLLNESSYEYTGSGAIISFATLPAISDYRLPVLTRILNGVRIESPKLNIGADANLFVSEGIIHYLEIFSLDGNYPDSEPQTYRLTQIWEGSPQKKITSGSP